MEQIYMIEFFLDQIKCFTDQLSDGEDPKNKKLIVSFKFGPRAQFDFKESAAGDIAETRYNNDTQTNREMWIRELRSGKSYMFPSYADTLMRAIDKFPLVVTVWNEDPLEADRKIFVGIGTMKWHPKFHKFLADSVKSKSRIDPILHRELILLQDDCCCISVGYVDLIIRMSAFGGSITSTFQQVMTDDLAFIFTTDATPQIYEGKQITGEDINFCVAGPLYESITLQDPETKAKNDLLKIQNRCVKGESCKQFEVPDESALMAQCCDDVEETKPPIEKIKIGNVRGPCGNKYCLFALKLQEFLRNMDKYKPKEDEIRANEGNTGVCCEEKDAGQCAAFAKEASVDPKTCPDCVPKKVPQNDESMFAGILPKMGPKELECSDVRPEKDCPCDPDEYKLKNKCKTFDCQCEQKKLKRENREIHRPYCPAFIHKDDCPVTLLREEEENEEEATKPQKEEDEDDPLNPYGLPKIQLGPCPAPGKPCAPEGPPKKIPPEPKVTYGKICCSKEFERLRTFLKKFQKEQIISYDASCSQRIFDPRLRKCCDKNMQVGGLDRKTCCAAHKRGRKDGRIFWVPKQ